MITSHKNFPGTRFMGSKHKLLDFIWDNLGPYNFDTVLDAFSGSGVVSYMFKQKGKKVISNDFLTSSAFVTKALIENNNTLVKYADIIRLMNFETKDRFIQDTFEGLYYTNAENDFLDRIKIAAGKMRDVEKRAIVYSALVRACIKKRPRGVFTYVGQKYDDGRSDINKSLKEHFLEYINEYNNAVFDNGRKNTSLNYDVFSLPQKIVKSIDLVYLDPPYLSRSSDNDYVRRYHFVEGLVTNWKGKPLQEHTLTKKFKSYPSLFSSKNTIDKAFHDLFKMFSSSIIVLSYSSNSLPTKQQLVKMLKQYKKNVVVKELDHTYSFGTHSHKKNSSTNRVKEYLFIAS